MNRVNDEEWEKIKKEIGAMILSKPHIHFKDGNWLLDIKTKDSVLLYGKTIKEVRFSYLIWRNTQASKIMMRNGRYN